MRRNLLVGLFVGTGTLLILIGVAMAMVYEPPVWYSDEGAFYPMHYALADMSRPALLVISGIGMMLGGIAIAITNQSGASGRDYSDPRK
ncbi:hypothetical protein AB0B89_15975 [Sphaerisporangium sp. NPDC049002]|uniref:hypothetical protein n=1 Tax=Sphaerisporangium sp. NPDC049002 TaxID=3155392 RepID=UPI0033F14810